MVYITNKNKRSLSIQIVYQMNITEWIDQDIMITTKAIKRMWSVVWKKLLQIVNFFFYFTNLLTGIENYLSILKVSSVSLNPYLVNYSFGFTLVWVTCYQKKMFSLLSSLHERIILSNRHFLISSHFSILIQQTHQSLLRLQEKRYY